MGKDRVFHNIELWHNGPATKIARATDIISEIVKTYPQSKNFIQIGGEYIPIENTNYAFLLNNSAEVTSIQEANAIGRRKFNSSNYPLVSSVSPNYKERIELESEFLDWFENSNTFAYKFWQFRKAVSYYFKKYIWKVK